MPCDTTNGELTTLLPNQPLLTRLRLTQEKNCVHPVVQTRKVDRSQTPDSSSAIETNRQPELSRVLLLSALASRPLPHWGLEQTMPISCSSSLDLLSPLFSSQSDVLKMETSSGFPWLSVVDSMLPLQQVHVWSLVRELRSVCWAFWSKDSAVLVLCFLLTFCSGVPSTIKRGTLRTSMVAQWVRIHLPIQGSIPGSGRSDMPQSN